RLARPLAADLRRPWEKPTPPDRLTPARVRRDSRHLRPKAHCPAGAPKPSHPGPGRPPGSKNIRPTPRHDVHTVGKPGSAKRRTKKSTDPRPRRTG
ncbi:transposase, partial [Streptomyces sp. NPDC088348]